MKNNLAKLFSRRRLWRNGESGWRKKQQRSAMASRKSGARWRQWRRQLAVKPAKASIIQPVKQRGSMAQHRGESGSANQRQ
jgi:hypothetical protein